MKETSFEGIVNPGQCVREMKSHLKFPLYRDDEIGFKLTDEATNRYLHENDCDEDYETDEDILERSIKVCKRDTYATIQFVR